MIWVWLTKNRRLAIGDFIVLQMCRPRDDEQLVAEYVDLGQLVRLEGIFNGQRMETKGFLELTQFILAGLVEAEPDKFGPILRAFNCLIDRDGGNGLAIAVEVSS